MNASYMGFVNEVEKLLRYGAKVDEMDWVSNLDVILHNEGVSLISKLS
jgi:hypothetical protein